MEDSSVPFKKRKIFLCPQQDDDDDKDSSVTVTVSSAITTADQEERIDKEDIFVPATRIVNRKKCAVLNNGLAIKYYQRM